MIAGDQSRINTEDILQLADEIGFSHAAVLDMEALIFRPEVREMCSADRCRSHARSWSCPPAVGSLEKIAERAADYSIGVIVQTTGRTESDFDIASISRIMSEHNRSFDALVRQIRSLGLRCLPMGAGACRICRKCTYPERPCRHPDRMYPSMEAYGLLVSDVCVKSGLGYNYGTGTMTFTSCILTD